MNKNHAMSLLSGYHFQRLQAKLQVLPALRSTKMSPGIASKIVSRGARESAQPMMAVWGAWPSSTNWCRWTFWVLEPKGRPATNRLLPSFNSSRASSGAIGGSAVVRTFRTTSPPPEHKFRASVIWVKKLMVDAGRNWLWREMVWSKMCWKIAQSKAWSLLQWACSICSIHVPSLSSTQFSPFKMNQTWLLNRRNRQVRTMGSDLQPCQSACEPMTSNIFPDTILAKKDHKRMKLLSYTRTQSKLCTYMIVQYRICTLNIVCSTAQLCSTVLNRNGVALMFSSARIAQPQ